jgi:myo-inositol 2-dehydrogenase/D-chiro-inositol 1-dehydrogenase
MIIPLQPARSRRPAGTARLGGQHRGRTGGSAPLRSVEPGATFPAGKPHYFFMDRLADAFRTELTSSTEVVAGSRRSPCTIADALEPGWVAEACTLSLHERRPVRIDEVR